MQDKFQLLAGEHVDILGTLSPEVRQRVVVLKDLQVCLMLLPSLGFSCSLVSMCVSAC